ncbi:hypothetical protein [Burkholderia stagnalis]|uniref:hypothetical protein n=1 Tax=Burkholderia stagnalis TaxID=1503054 RepID=UPI000F5745D6|nr:hypothetical protein [Burkholderia stagnalis]MDY7806563.1 hypothetical protein [Burkholderia stagnalis]
MKWQTFALIQPAFRFVMRFVFGLMILGYFVYLIIGLRFCLSCFYINNKAGREYFAKSPRRTMQMCSSGARRQARAAGAARTSAARDRAKSTRAKRHVLLFRFRVFIGALVDKMCQLARA